MNKNQLNDGIWKILSEQKTLELDLTSFGYRQYYTIMQHIENLRNIEYFCNHYTKFEG